MLKNNIHHSPKLQRSYNKTKDKSIFVFEIIEQVSEDRLEECEQFYIDLHNSFKEGYNCCELVNTPYTSTKMCKKNKNKILLNDYYNEFLELYIHNQERFIFGNVLLDRLHTKYYKYQIYKNINNIMKWFIDNYSLNYIGRFSVSGNQQYYLIISDTNKNEFSCYKWHKGKMYISEYDTKIHRNILESKGLLDLKKHYVLDIPIYKSKQK